MDHNEYFTELADSSNARTQRMCTGRPEQTHVRTALLRYEKQINGDGWDQHPKLFHLFRHERSGKVDVVTYHELSKMLVSDHYPPAEGLHRFALVMESVRKAAFASGEDDPILRADPAMYQAYKFANTVVPGYLQRVRANPSGDLVAYRSKDWVFHGAGFTTEAYMVITPDADAEQVLEAADRRNLYRQPGRVECRQTHVVCRDGHYWQVSRTRRTSTIDPIRWTHVSTPDDGDSYIGDVPNSLSRCCAAIASNPVHILPTFNTEEHLRDIVNRRNAQRAAGNQQ